MVQTFSIVNARLQNDSPDPKPEIGVGKWKLYRPRKM